MTRATGQPVAPHKGCNSSSCCSPAKLWRTLQTLIKSDSKKELIQFFKDDRLEHIVRVALTSRITNDAALYPPSQKHKIIRLTCRESLLCLGKSFTDLNLLQLALLCSSEATVMALLNQLKLHATIADVKQFVNHVWGQGNTSLHLAVFLKRPLVIKALMDLGCVSGALNVRKKSALDCCLDDEVIMGIFLSDNNNNKKAKTPTVFETVNQKQKQVGNETATCSQQQPQQSEAIDRIEKIVPSIVTISDQQQQQQQQHADLVLVQYCLLTLMKQHLIGKTRLPTSFSIVQQCIAIAQLKKPPDITTSLIMA